MGNLEITIIRAENLHGTRNSHVMCYQGNKSGQTRPAKGPSPTYAADPDSPQVAILFEVDDDQTPLIVQILDIDRGQPLLETQVSFDDIKQGLVP